MTTIIKKGFIPESNLLAAKYECRRCNCEYWDDESPKELHSDCPECQAVADRKIRVYGERSDSLSRHKAVRAFFGYRLMGWVFLASLAAAPLVLVLQPPIPPAFIAAPIALGLAYPMLASRLGENVRNLEEYEKAIGSRSSDAGNQSGDSSLSRILVSFFHFPPSLI